MKTFKWAPAVLAGCFLSQASWATTIYDSSNTANGQAFVSACSGSQAYGGTPNPGSSAYIDPAGPYAAYTPYNSCAQAQGPSVSTGLLSNPVLPPGSIQSPNAFSNSGGIAAQPGAISFFATDTASSFDHDAGGWGSGGWNDSFIWTGPTGMWEPQFIVNATLSVGYDSCTPYNGYLCPSQPPQPTGDAILELAMVAANPGQTFLQYLETSDEMAAFAAHNANTILPADNRFAGKVGDWLSAGGLEEAGWWADAADPSIVAQNQLVTFAIPVVQGQMVNFGVYASYMIDGASGGGPSAIFLSTQTIDPEVGFANPGSVDTGNGILPVLPTYIGSSSSGFDYSQAATPEPGAWVLAGLGTALCLFAKRRVRR